MSSPVVRWQVNSSQPDVAASFYATLLGWTVSQDNGMGYREIRTGDAKGINGGIWPAPPGQGGLTQLFVEVPDIDARVAKAASLGTKAIMPKAVLPDGGAVAVLLDPTGLTIGVCTLVKR